MEREEAEKVYDTHDGNLQIHSSNDDEADVEAHAVSQYNTMACPPTRDPFRKPEGSVKEANMAMQVCKHHDRGLGEGHAAPVHQRSDLCVHLVEGIERAKEVGWDVWVVGTKEGACTQTEHAK